MPSDNHVHHMNLSIHKIFNPQYCVPYNNNDEDKQIIKKRRCTISCMYDKDTTYGNNNDYLNYNFNNSITKRKKYTHNHLQYNKTSQMKSIIKLRNSVEKSIKKSAALRSIVKKNIKSNNNENYVPNEKNYLDKTKVFYLNKHIEGRDSDHFDDLNNIKLRMSRNLNETYILSNTTQSDNYFRNKYRNRDSLNTNKGTAHAHLNSGSTISSFNFEKENENKILKTNAYKDTYDALDQNIGKQMYPYIPNTTDKEIKEIFNKEKNNMQTRIRNALKRRHSTEFLNDYDKYNYSDSIYFNKRIKYHENNNKAKIRRHSDTSKYIPWNDIYLNDLRHDTNRNILDSSLLHEYNKNNLDYEKYVKHMKKHSEDNDSDNPIFHNSFFKNTEEFENKNMKRKEKVEPLGSNDEDDSVLKDDAEYVFSKKFFKDIYSNIKRKGEMIFIDELLKEDEECYISSTKLNKITENAKNKEMKYYYIDRMFLYRHARNVIDDSDYEKYRNKCRSEYKYLDVPIPNLREIMNLKPINNLDEIDDTDEFYDVEVKLIEKYYHKCNNEKQKNTITFEEKKLLDSNNFLKKRKLMAITSNESTEEVSTLENREKREKLISFMNRIKKEKDSFCEQILDAPDFSKLLESVFTSNESFLLSHQLFNVQYAAPIGPIAYLLKTEDEHYIYRAIEVSRLFEEKVKSILDNHKMNSGIKDRNEPYECLSNGKYPFLYELDVKYYLRIPMSAGWTHFGYLKNQHNVLFFRRPKNT